VAGRGDGEKFRQSFHNAEDDGEPWPPFVHGVFTKAQDVIVSMTRAYSQRGTRPSSKPRICLGNGVLREIARGEAPTCIDNFERLAYTQQYNYESVIDHQVGTILVNR
jgi:hypothetical protein